MAPGARLATLLLCASALGIPSAPVSAQVEARLTDGLVWRDIGPYRGGRTKAVVGVPDRPGLFYVGFVNGGLWKSTDYGRIWTPIFDDQPTGSIGAVAVAPPAPAR